MQLLPSACVLLLVLTSQHAADGAADQHRRQQLRQLRSQGAARQLLATCEPGTFSALRPTVMESKAAVVEWAGTDDQHVFLVTIKAAVWRSKDGGTSFEDISERFKTSIQSSEAVQVTQILSHKSQPNLMIFVGAGEYMWTSKDYGETLVPHKAPGGVRGLGATLKLHPTRHNWLLAHAKRPGCRLTEAVEGRCAADLFVAQDAFTSMSWVNLTANAAGKLAGFVDWGWAVGGCTKAAAAAAAAGSPPPPSCASLGLPDEALFATAYEKQGDWDTAWDPDVHFVRSDTWFKSIEQKVPCGNQFELLGSQVYLAVSNRCPTDWAGKPRSPGDASGAPGITLYTSGDGGASFTAACLPVALKQEGYELLESHDGQGALVIVDYLVKTGLGNLQASSAYTAGPHHSLFSLSLPSLFKQDVLSASTDFLRVDGIPGVFIANQLTTTGTDSPFGVKLHPTVRTRMTLNGGSSWADIKAPSHFNHKQCDRCGGAKDCSLHLHGASSWFFGAVQYPSAYSNPSAPGLLLASGNVAGPDAGLDDNDGVCTWLSFDGGVTWADVAEGTWIYEYADWGGLVVMSKHELNGPADEVRFSYDYGRCWQSVPLATAMFVENIRIEPDGQRPKVLLHGKACRRTSHPKCSYDATDTRSSIEGLVYALDVSQLMGSDRLPRCAAADYETWQLPPDNTSPRCLLGAQRSFTRRKQDAACLQGADWVRPPPSARPCACTRADVECDYGYTRADSDGDGSGGEPGSCRALARGKLPSSCPAIEQGSYTVSSTGRRLVHGDACEGVQSVIPDTDGKGSLNPGAKPGVQPGSGGGGGRHAHGVFVWLVVAAVACGVFGAWYHFLASAVARARVDDAAAAAKRFGVSVLALAADGAAALLARLSGGRAGGGGGGAWGGSAAGAVSSVLSAGGGGGAGLRYVPLEDEELNYFQPLPEPSEAAKAASELVLTGSSGGAGGSSTGSGGGSAGVQQQLREPPA